MRNGLQSSNYLIVVHTLWSDNSYRTSHAFSQFIGGSYHTAVLHGLDLSLVSDINLNACFIIIRKAVLYKLCQLILLFEGVVQLTRLLLVCQFRIPENIIGSACIDLKILFLFNPFCKRIYHVSDDGTVYACLLLHPCDHRKIDLLRCQTA